MSKMVALTAICCMYVCINYHGMWPVLCGWVNRPLNRGRAQAQRQAKESGAGSWRNGADINVDVGV